MSNDMPFEGKTVPCLMDADVVVGGGGPGGWSAAVSAAKEGAKVILVEHYGFLGGMDTLAFSYQFNARDASGGIFGEKPLIGGIFQELISRLIDDGGMLPPNEVWHSHMWHDIRYRAGIPFDPEMLKIVLGEMLTDYGVKLLFHSTIVGAAIDGERIDSIIIQTKSGRYKLRGKLFIDATGDADISTYAGVPIDQDPNPRGCSMNWILGNVDIEKAKNFHNMEIISQLQRKAIENGDLLSPSEKNKTPWAKSVTFPVEDVTGGMPYSIGLGFLDSPDGGHLRFNRKGEVRVWGAHVKGLNALDPIALSEAEMSVRRQIKNITLFLKKYVPGFEKSYIVSTGIQVGIQETRRIIGEYTLTEEDLVLGRRFSDSIAKCCLIIFKEGYGKPESWGPLFDVPYRCLIPKKINNLLASGRCISYDRKVAKNHGLNFSGTSAAIGEAAGTAAAILVQESKFTRDIPIVRLQERLRAKGANID